MLLFKKYYASCDFKMVYDFKSELCKCYTNIKQNSICNLYVFAITIFYFHLLHAIFFSVQLNNEMLLHSVVSFLYYSHPPSSTPPSTALSFSSLLIIDALQFVVHFVFQFAVCEYKINGKRN